MPQQQKRRRPEGRMGAGEYEPRRNASERNNRKKKKKKSHALKYFLCALLALALALMGYIYFGIYKPMTEQPGTMLPGTLTDEETDEELVVTEEDLIYVDRSDLSTNINLGDEVINILMLGVDARAGVYDGLTDTMIILSINPKTNGVKMTSILRDTLVTIPGRKKQQKINAANVFGGPNLAIKTVNEVFDMNIEDYLIVNFESVIAMVDTIGGIDISVTEAEMKQVNENLQGYRGDLDVEGIAYNEEDFKKLTKFGDSVHLNGHQALAYARIRKIDSDYVRAERQRTVILAIGDKVSASNVFQIGTLATQLFPYVSTSLGLQEIITLASVALNVDASTVGQMQIPVAGTFKEGKFDGMWCIKPNYETNIQMLHEFIYDDGI